MPPLVCAVVLPRPGVPSGFDGKLTILSESAPYQVLRRSGFSPVSPCADQIAGATNTEFRYVAYGFS